MTIAGAAPLPANFQEDFSLDTNALGVPESGLKACQQVPPPFQSGGTPPPSGLHPVVDPTRSPTRVWSGCCGAVGTSVSHSLPRCARMPRRGHVFAVLR